MKPSKPKSMWRRIGSCIYNIDEEKLLLMIAIICALVTVGLSILGWTLMISIGGIR